MLQQHAAPSCAPATSPPTHDERTRDNARLIKFAERDIACAVETLRNEYRRQFGQLLIERDRARERADKLAQLLQPATAIVEAYLHELGQFGELRDIATDLLAAIRRLPGGAR